MPARRLTATLLALLLTAAASAPVLAHGRGRVHFGVFVGAPLLWHRWYYPPPAWYYPPPVYYYPSVVTVPAQPRTYVEREPAPQAYWYYCRDAGAYYPYVKHCPGGWAQVLPSAPADR